MYNHQIPSLTQLIETSSFTTSWSVDRYLIAQTLGDPVTVTLGEKGLCDGDQFTLIDANCNAQTQPINIVTSGSATILSAGSSTQISSNCGGIRLTYNAKLNQWYPEELVPSGSMGEAFLQGGNAFGAPATLGTLDANTLTLVTDGNPAFEMNLSGQQLAYQNNVATPPYAFHSDPGTGMYLVSTGKLAFAVGGSQALTLDLPSAGVASLDTAGTLELGAVSATGIQIGGAGATPTFPDNLEVASSIDTITLDATLLQIGANRAANIQIGQVTTVGESTGVGICAFNPLASLHIGGSMLYNTTTFITANYTVDTGASPASGPDLAVVTNTTAGAVTITLPISVAIGRVLVIADGTGEAAAHHVTIAATGGGEINGAANQTLSNAWGSYTLMAVTAIAWVILAKN